MYLPVIRVVSIATPKTSLSREVVRRIWVPMIQANADHEQERPVGDQDPKSLPMCSEPSM
jgi:hypothetical protein